MYSRADDHERFFVVTNRLDAALELGHAEVEGFTTAHTRTHRVDVTVNHAAECALATRYRPES
jgi:hypothetical protein